MVNPETLTFEVDSRQFCLLLPPNERSRLSKFTNNGVTLGIRPQHIYAKPQNEYCHKIPVQVIVTEPVGNEIFIYFTIGNSTEQYVSRIPSDIQPPTEEMYDLYFDMLKGHFFERTTGDKL
ncbi:MAG: hypothetical protein QME52_07260 [Bacteroidota bacterium]|nr:hypothetical protein [Bacteroidota bacterium]